MRLNSSGEHKAASNDRKYLLKILKTIDNIQTTIHQKLNRTASKDHYSRQSSSPTKNIHPKTLKISNKPKSLAKSLKNSDVFLRTQADCQQYLKERKYGYVLPLRNQKKDSQASFFQTPKKNQARDLKDNNFSMLNLAFDSPFDRCVFERSEITKKLSQTPKKLLLHEKQNDLSFLATEQKKNSSSLTQKRLVPKERAGKPEQRPLQKQDYSSGIERYYANQQQKLRLLEATNQLQELFEKCVIQKKYAGREQQLALRCKMESLSQRIAKIKHKQSHFINH